MAQKYSPEEIKEYAKLFEEAEKELVAKTDDSIELGFEQFQTKVDRQDCLALFDLAEELLENPNARKSIVTEVRTSHKRKVEAKELSDRLAQVEKRLSPAAMSLRELGKLAGIGKHRREEGVENYIEVPVVAFGKRMLSFSIDAALALLIAVPLSLAIQYIVFPGSVGKLFSSSEMADFEYVSFLGSYLASLSLLSIVLPLYWLLTQGTTIGMRYCNLKLVRLNGKIPTFNHYLVRALSYPITIATIGISSIGSRGQGFHELISRTTVAPLTFIEIDAQKLDTDGLN